MEPRQEPVHNELHIVTQPVGHIMSRDCWCEPVDMEWQDMEDVGRVLVVYHKDDSPHHHRVILAQRTANQDWITRGLDNVKLYPPRALPPPKGLE